MLMCCFNYLSIAQQANVGACNPAIYTPWVNSSSPAFTVTNQTTGTTALLGSWSTGIIPFATNTVPFVIDNNLGNVGKGSVTGIGNATMRVTDATNTYSIGNFAGFKLNGNISLGMQLTIKTYDNGTLQESQQVPIQTGDFYAGFITTKTYDAIEMVFASTIVGGGSIDVYHAVNAKICPGTLPTVCNTPTTLNAPTFPVTVSGGSEGILGGAVTAAANAVSASTTDFATLGLGSLTGSAAISIKDPSTPFGATGYPAGTFAGFDVENIDFVTNKFAGLTVTTFLNGVQQEKSGVFNVLVLASSGQSLVSYGPPDALGRQKIGFVASKAFDEIKLNFSKLLGNPTKVYGAIVDTRCTGASLACNTSADFTFPAVPVSEYSGQAGGCISTLVGQGALVSADTSDYASFIEGVQVGCASWVGIKNNKAGDVYAAGTFAGFETAAYGLVSISVADLGTVSTYLDGAFQEQSTSANLIATSFITGRKRTIGFKTTKDFDEIRYTRIGVAGISTGETRVYKGVVEKVCPGPALVCNVPTTLNKPLFPMTTYSYMVPYGVVVGCAGTLTGEEALVTPDPNDFALMTMVQSLGCLRYVGVKDAAGTLYPSGTYASVEIENMSLITASLGDLQSIVTYKAGVEQERKLKGSLITASILTGGRQSFGFVTTQDFDEVRYEEFTVITPATLVATRVYGFNVMKLCDGAPLACTTGANPQPQILKLNLPAYPVTVASNANDAFLGVGVSVNQLLNPERVVTADTTDFATIANSGVNSWASITVTDQKATYPIGSFAGFDVFNSTALNLDLLGGVFITTYLDGALQESKSANNLLLNLIGSTGIATSSRRRIGFVTTKPFDEIKYSQGQLVGVNLGTTQVFGAVVSKTAADCAGALTLATPPPAALTSPAGSAKSGNAATELTPTGGTAPYTYSSGAGDPACIAPSGATQITGVSITAATGAYTYTTPSTPGSYYFCVKVCDASTPAKCAVKVYPVTVTAASGLTLATPPASALNAAPSSAKTGNAATELTPSGGTAPYTYSSGTGDPACVAPSGATALTGVTISASGAYSYTAPATPGSYYFCVKVCDSATPAICSVKVYQISVAATCAVVGGAIPSLK